LADLVFPTWNGDHQTAFENTKSLVLGTDCLTTIDHDNMDENCVFVTCDSSDWCTGTVLSYGPTWETARPVAFDSMALKSAQLNYPVHKKELLAIICALQKWHSDLFRIPITIYTDHQTLENFDHQKDLLHRQAHWQEFLVQYNHHITYIPGEHNCIADALSRLPNSVDTQTEAPVAALLMVVSDPALLKSIVDGYTTDPFCTKIARADKSIDGIHWQDGLLYIGDRLVIPHTGSL
jgi:hypothetical protein